MYMHYLNSYRPFHFLGKKMPQSEMGNFFNLLSPFLVTSAGMRETDSLRRPRLICHRRCKACKCCSTGLLSIPIMSLSKVWSKLTDCPLENGKPIPEEWLLAQQCPFQNRSGSQQVDRICSRLKTGLLF